MNKVSIALIGANGRIGTELCFFFRQEPDIELVPVVRNTLGAAFLTHQGFDCKIGDVGDESDAKALLQDVDAVVISAYAHLPGPSGIAINRKIVENCVRFSNPNCRIIYFSSIRALGGRADRRTPRLAIPRTYDRNKRLIESTLLKWCKRTGKKGVALRLGHVYGQNQPRTQTLKADIAASEVLKLQVEAEQASNVVHTIAIQDCIKVCVESEVMSGVYAVVNTPQWSWKEVFDYYNQSDTTLVFTDSTPHAQPRLSRRILNRSLQFLSSQREYLRDIRPFLPPAIDDIVARQSAIQSIKSEIRALERSDVKTLTMSEFAYRPMPGRVVPSLANTADLLRQYTIPDHIFVSAREAATGRR